MLLKCATKDQKDQINVSDVNHGFIGSEIALHEGVDDKSMEQNKGLMLVGVGILLIIILIFIFSLIFFSSSKQEKKMKFYFGYENLINNAEEVIIAGSLIIAERLAHELKEAEKQQKEENVSGVEDSSITISKAKEKVEDKIKKVPFNIIKERLDLINKKRKELSGYLPMFFTREEYLTALKRDKNLNVVVNIEEEDGDLSCKAKKSVDFIYAAKSLEEEIESVSWSFGKNDDIDSLESFEKYHNSETIIAELEEIFSVLDILPVIIESDKDEKIEIKLIAMSYNKNIPVQVEKLHKRSGERQKQDKTIDESMGNISYATNLRIKYSDKIKNYICLFSSEKSKLGYKVMKDDSNNLVENKTEEEKYQFISISDRIKDYLDKNLYSSAMSLMKEATKILEAVHHSRKSK